MTNPNDPASPILSKTLAALPEVNCSGFTKREVFAMAAMQGMCADPNSINAEGIAASAVRFADALIKALNNPEV